MMGWYSVPPPMPAGTATIPMKKQVINRAMGQNHQGIVLMGTTLSAASAGATSASSPMTNTPARFSAGVLAMWLERRMRLGDVLVVQVLRVIGLHKKEPPLCQQAAILDGEGNEEYLPGVRHHAQRHAQQRQWKCQQ